MERVTVWSQTNLNHCRHHRHIVISYRLNHNHNDDKHNKLKILIIKNHKSWLRCSRTGGGRLLFGHHCTSGAYNIPLHHYHSHYYYDYHYHQNYLVCTKFHFIIIHNFHLWQYFQQCQQYQPVFWWLTCYDSLTIRKCPFINAKASKLCTASTSPIFGLVY